MGLTWPIVGAVLVAALLHAGWNALIKSSTDKRADTALLAIGGALLALPMLLAAGPPPAAAWPYLLGSVAVHLGYYGALAEAYRHGDLGLGYPVMRGTAPLLVALGSGVIVGEAPSGAAWAGVTGIAAGVALVGLAHPGDVLRHRRALVYALASAVLIAAYTTLDGLGVRASGAAALRYTLLLFVLNGVSYPAWVWGTRTAAARAVLVAYARVRWPFALGGAAASFAAYAIALWAMTRAPIASVAALRETSVLFAALLGVLLLKERFGPQRALGTGVIVAGVMALRFG